MGEEKSKEQRIGELRYRAEALRDEADGLRDEASTLEREAYWAEREAAEIERELALEGKLFRSNDALLWGDEIAKVIYKSTERIHFTIFGESWVSNGHIAWATDRIPDTCRVPASGLENTLLRRELKGPIVDIDTAAPVAKGGDTLRPWSDFDTEAGRVRFQDPFTELARALGDHTGVTSGDRILVAFRDNRPVFVAMPMTRGADEVANA